MVRDEDDWPEESEGRDTLVELEPGEAEAMFEPMLMEHVARESDTIPVQPVVELPAQIDGVMLGRLSDLEADGAVRVVLWGCKDPNGVMAKSMVRFGEADIGAEVAVMFEGGDPRKALVMGRIFQPEEKRRPSHFPVP